MSNIFMNIKEDHVGESKEGIERIIQVRVQLPFCILYPPINIMHSLNKKFLFQLIRYQLKKEKLNE